MIALARGVTLIELMVALAVVAILSAIAWPGYAAVIHRANRQEARLALLELQHAQERHYLQHFIYTDLLTVAPAAGGLGRSASSLSGEYQLSVQVDARGQGYSASAVPDPIRRQAGDRTCARFSVDQTGRRSAFDNSGTDTTGVCWR